MPINSFQFAFRSSQVLLFHASGHSESYARMILDKLHQFQDVMRAQELDDRVDLTHNLPYQNQRELDAFARCMAIQHPCTAALKYYERSSGKTVFEVFFNHNPGEGKYAKFTQDRVEEYSEQFLRQLNKTEDAVVHVLKHSALRVLDQNHTPPLLRECSHNPKVSVF
ncbi:MAG: hypothetical protein V4485_00675 [Pseudomonadota bacterium]